MDSLFEINYIKFVIVGKLILACNLYRYGFHYLWPEKLYQECCLP